MAHDLTDEQRTSITNSINLSLLAIQRYNQALADDALNPQVSYTLEGESVDRNRWRTGIAEMKRILIGEVKELRKILGKRIQVHWLGKTDMEALDYEQRN